MPRFPVFGLLLLFAAGPALAGEPCVARRDASAGNNAFSTPQPCAQTAKKKPGTAATSGVAVDHGDGTTTYRFDDTSVSVSGYVRSDTVVGNSGRSIRER